MGNFDQLSLMAAGLGNKIIMDNVEPALPGFYVPIRKMALKDLLNTSSTDVHPAFIINGEEKDVLYIGKYQGVHKGGKMYSLPMEVPAHSANFDTFLSRWRAKGGGHHMITLAEWAVIALWCRKNGCMPKGNNNYGKDSSESSYYGIPGSYESDGKTRHILTGSGPVSYSHNGEVSGIYDLNGNVWEWIAGYRTMNGEIQIIPDNNAALASCNMGASSTEWKAIMPDGSLVAPGTAGTLKWNWLNGKITLDTVTTVEDVSRDTSFNALAVNTTNVPNGAPMILKALALFPDEPNGDYGGDHMWMNTSGERLLFRGGAYNSGGGAGVFHGGGNHPRSHANVGIGSRGASTED